MSTLSARNRRKTPAERAAEIALAARQIALTDGLAALTVRAVAARVGVAPALVAHYQPNMNVLVASAFGAIVAAEIHEVAAELAACPTSVHALGALIDTLLSPERSAVTAIWLDAWSLGRRNPALAAEVGRQMDAWQGFLVALLRGGVGRGEFVVDDAPALAWQLLGIIDGLTAHATVRYGDARTQQSLVRTIVEHELALAAGALNPAAT
ncbi:TetR/AcrR family transcriptional regulator [Cryobacterium gelidum]|uniref:TetR family transcriptional regulator n=1 Tax=Cryobacterium gelidum TaxID=1259164 RepID=A0A4R9AY43_9MICO|nr:TetR family transcriptional regulator C-terminal domain-containing protein [Cryobacterium gelidum]TFD72368.1 TetR family transcriptional regulator [Cryobacterium gelidum]